MATRQWRDGRGLRETDADRETERAGPRGRPIPVDLDLPLEGFERPLESRQRPLESRQRPLESRQRPLESRQRPPESRQRPAVAAKRSASAPRQAPPAPRHAPPELGGPPRRPARRESANRAIQFERERNARTGLPRRQQILLPLIALIATGAGAVAAIAVTNEPQTSSLRRGVSSLQGQIASVRQELTTLQRAAASNSQVSRLNRTVAGLGHTVGGLQGSVTPLKARVDGLSVCLPQLQGELAGLGVRGSGKQAALVNSASLSPGCAALLGGG